MERGRIKSGLLILTAVCAIGFCPRLAAAADKVTFVTDFGYNGRHADNQRRREAALRLMRERVPRAADALHFLQAEVRLIGDESRRGGERLAQETVNQSGLL